MPSSSLADAPEERRKAGPRAPSRNRGVLRYAALLDAAEALLQSEDPDVIGLHQIATRAGVPTASAYHFFPTKEAAYTALAERYCDGILGAHRSPIDARLIKTWKDLARIDMRRAADYYNMHPAALKIIYGGYGGVGARDIDKLLAMKLSGAATARLDKIFHVPHVAEDYHKSEISLAILDSIWTISVRRHGRITDDYFEEAYRATVAYRLLYLPEYLRPREILTTAAANGQSLLLPFDDDDVARSG
jgi:AcrR family transcriptional regulator